MNSRYTTLVPEYVHEAFESWYAYAANDEKCEEFAGKWGGFSYEHFLRALEQGTGNDRFCAMFALGASSYADAANRLHPFLSSTQRDERCVSAIVLGMRGDARAYPFLENTLLEGLSLEEWMNAFANRDQKLLDDLFLCDRFRPKAVGFLATWHSPTLIQTMIQTLGSLWILEKASSRFGIERRAYDTLCYALGQRGVFTALETLDFPPAYQRIARVYLVLGALHAIPEPTFMRWVLQNEDQTQHCLEETFHVDAENARYCLETFYQENEVHLAYRAGLNEQAIEEGLATHFVVEVGEGLSAFFMLRGASDHFSENGKAETPPQEEPIEQKEPVRLCFNRGHTSTIWSVAWSLDGTRVVSGSEDSTVQVWNGQTGKQIHLFRGHTACVTAVAWSPDGQWVASGGCDNTVFVWNAQTGETITTYTKHSAWICQGLAWSPDGAYIASASWDGTVHIWAAMTGATRVCYRGHQGVVTSVAWSPDGTQVVSGGGYPACAVHVWNADTGQLNLLYKAHMQDTAGRRPILAEVLASDEAWARGPDSLRSVAWSPDGRWIASVGLRNVLRVWNAQTGEDLLAMAQSRTCGPLVWSADSKYLATAHHNGVDFWNVAQKKSILNYNPVSRYSVTALAWSPDMRSLVTGAEHPRICVWEVDIRS